MLRDCNDTITQAKPDDSSSKVHRESAAVQGPLKSKGNAIGIDTPSAATASPHTNRLNPRAIPRSTATNSPPMVGMNFRLNDGTREDNTRVAEKEPMLIPGRNPSWLSSQNIVAAICFGGFSLTQESSHPLVMIDTTDDAKDLVAVAL